ncbi:MAG: MFS transporter, partial [Saprospiraceae bacterium]
MKRILAVIVISQFLCTSLWFAGNAILPDIVQVLRLDQDFVAHLTSMVQFGFVIGTLIFAILTIADRFSPSLVFFLCSMIAALFNLAISLDGINSIEVLFCRFVTGFFL